jgi:MinD-like ATPase involved in chromosome partitioning or flagellar assembly
VARVGLVPGKLTEVTALGDTLEAGGGADGAGGEGGVRPGRLVAVAGLCGGAGASTLAYLLCCAAIAEGRRPVLCADATGRGGIAVCAGSQPAMSFARASVELEAGRRPAPDRLFAVSKDGVRVLSGAPSLERSVPAACGAGRLLSDAQAAHALTVVDCGTLAGEYERLALGSAGHVVLVVPASGSGIERGAGLAAQALEVCAAGARVVLIARVDGRERKAPVSELAAIADRLSARLVLFPQIDHLHQRPAAGALEHAQLALQALQGVLAR